MEAVPRFYEFICDGCDGVAVRGSRHVAPGPIFCSKCSERETQGPLCYMCGGPQTDNEPCPFCGFCRGSSDDANDEDSEESGGVSLLHESGLCCNCRFSQTPCEHCLESEESGDEKSDNQVSYSQDEGTLPCGHFEWERDTYLGGSAFYSQFEEVEDLEVDFEAEMLLEALKELRPI